MMYTLYFNSLKFPRTINRKEWKEIWRWKRITEKEVKKLAQEQIENFVAFGSTMPRHIKRDIIDDIIYPSLLIHDKQEL